MDDTPRPETVDTEILMLRAEHRALDARIEALVREGAPNQLELQRLKKQKLALKDLISLIERMRLPDIIA